MSRTEAQIKTFVEGLDAVQIDQLKASADQHRARLREIDELRARFEEQAASVGLTADEVINGAKKVRRGRKPKREQEADDDQS